MRSLGLLPAVHTKRNVPSNLPHRALEKIDCTVHITFCVLLFSLGGTSENYLLFILGCKIKIKICVSEKVIYSFGVLRTDSFPADHVKLPFFLLCRMGLFIAALRGLETCIKSMVPRSPNAWWKMENEEGKKIRSFPPMEYAEDAQVM